MQHSSECLDVNLIPSNNLFENTNSKCLFYVLGKGKCKPRTEMQHDTLYFTFSVAQETSFIST